ncbi:DNA/RNA non-specific endonuclease [Carboxylicivirga sp. A043]|uniref:DNA/RNA non-specific endonuclease n=1 Tax=Carboxylicivirga litoralis TaxID=2816963 RepID=UPI0021CB2B91|nr:DNA/RNA non-specific endonuclease [Carboxylicivirga sp. A043]MCU4155225.1 DNA/RNA non-specific endonuclease [Carboxylicivirga sp. A043]
MHKYLIPVLFLITTFASAQEFNYLPLVKGDTLIKHTYYTLSYSEQHEQPYWVAYELKPEMLHKVVERKDNFRVDPSVKTNTPTYGDYKSAPLYDAGHMLCSRNMQFSCESMDETFFMSNMSPQHKDLNRIRWAHLEALERSMVERNGTLYVVCGPVLKDIIKTIGIDNKVSVPNYYYKVILEHDAESTKCIAFLMPNEKCPLPLKSYVVSVDSIESMTGIDFFHELPDAIENKIESFPDTINWSFKKPRSNYGYNKEAVKCN